MIKIMKRNTRSLVFLLVIAVGAVGFLDVCSFAASAVARVENSNQSRATKARTPRTDWQSTEVTSTDRHTACKRGCEEKYSSCVAAKEAKGWSDDRAEKTCGLAARSCKAGCDRR
jgi:hypothetical protein